MATGCRVEEAADSEEEAEEEEWCSSAAECRSECGGCTQDNVEKGLT